MQKKIVLTLALFGLMSLTGNVQAKMTVDLTKKEFLQKVWNFETHPKAFKFLGNKPTIIDFHASWCGPCKKLNPILEELAVKYQGKVVFYKIDVDRERELAQGFGIQSIPSILFIPQKGEPSMSAGFMNKEELIKIIDSQLLK